MPVSAWIGAGIAAPGFTSVDHSELTSKPSTSITPISVMRSDAGWRPPRAGFPGRTSLLFYTVSGPIMQDQGAVSSGHWHVPRLGFDPLEPGSHGRVGRKVEAAV